MRAASCDKAVIALELNRRNTRQQARRIGAALYPPRSSSKTPGASRPNFLAKRRGDAYAAPIRLLKCLGRLKKLTKP